MDTNVEDLIIIDWEKGEDEYGEGFYGIIDNFINTCLKKNLVESGQAIDAEDWVAFLGNIHNIKGAIGYCQGLRLFKLTDQYQAFLIKYFPKDEIPGIESQTEKLPPLPFDERAKLTTFQTYLKLLDEVRLFLKESQTKNIQFEGPTFTFEIERRKAEEAIKRVDLLGPKQQTLISKDQQNTLMKQQSLKPATQTNIDPPKNDKCCSNCSLM